MIYSERVMETSKDQFTSLFIPNKQINYDRWIVACRVLEISPAEYVKLLHYKFNAEVRYYSKANLFSYFWKTKEEAIIWRDYITEIAREKNFHV